MSRPKIISEKVILKAHLFDVIEQEILFGDVKKQYQIVKRKPAVFVIPVGKNDEVYAIKEFRYIFDKYVLSFPAGFVEENEEFLEAAKRELKEETGLIAENMIKVGIIQMATSATFSELHIFLAQELKEGSQKLDESEDIKVKKIPINQIHDKINNGEIIDASDIAGFILAEDYLKKQI